MAKFSTSSIFKKIGKDNFEKKIKKQKKKKKESILKNKKKKKTCKNKKEQKLKKKHVKKLQCFIHAFYNKNKLNSSVFILP